MAGRRDDQEQCSGELVLIPLTCRDFPGLIAIVDEIDADLAKTAWHARKNPKGKHWYARRVRWIGPSGDKRSHCELLHRVILARKLGRSLLRSEIVDHIDEDPLNNTRANLRLASTSQNTHNQRLRRADNKSTSLKGVTFDPSKGKQRPFTAQLQKDGKKVFRGQFATAEEAHQAYCRASVLHYGVFSPYWSSHGGEIAPEGVTS